MRLISKKTPVILAGGALIGKRIARMRAARKRKSFRPKIAAAGALGVIGAGVTYFARAKRRKAGGSMPPMTDSDGQILGTLEPEVSSKS